MKETQTEGSALDNFTVGRVLFTTFLIVIAHWDTMAKNLSL